MNLVFRSIIVQRALYSNFGLKFNDLLVISNFTLFTVIGNLLQHPFFFLLFQCIKVKGTWFIPSSAWYPKWCPWVHRISIPKDLREFQRYGTRRWSLPIGKSQPTEKCISEWHTGCADSKTMEHQAIPERKKEKKNKKKISYWNLLNKDNWESTQVNKNSIQNWNLLC